MNRRDIPALYKFDIWIISWPPYLWKWWRSVIIRLVITGGQESRWNWGNRLHQKQTTRSVIISGDLRTGLRHVPQHWRLVGLLLSEVLSVWLSYSLSSCLSSCDYRTGPVHPNKHSRGKIWMVIVIARTHIWEEFLHPHYLKGLWPPGSMPTHVSIKQNQRVTWHGMPWLRKSPDLLPSPKTVDEFVCSRRSCQPGKHHNGPLFKMTSLPFSPHCLTPHV